MEITEFGDREIGELAALIRHYRKNGLWTGDGESSFTQGPSAGIVVKNTEATEIPAYGCMEVIGTVEEDGRNYVRVKKPTSAGLLFLFNGHTAIEASGYGTAQRGPVYWVYKNSGTVTHGNRWAPTAGQYYLTAGAGPYVVLGEDAIAANVFRVHRDDVARLYRFTLNASLASGTADADILEMDGTDTGIDATVRDPAGIFATLVTVGDDGLCLYQDGKYYVIQANCP
jgi:hypothetical protein